MTKKYSATLALETDSNKGTCLIQLVWDEDKHVMVISEQPGSSGEGFHKEVFNIIRLLFEAHGELDPTKLSVFYLSSSGEQYQALFEEVTVDGLAYLGGVSKLVPVDGDLPVEV